MAARKMPALLAYNGQAYKHLRAHALSDEALRYAQKHRRITQIVDKKKNRKKRMFVINLRERFASN